MSCVFCQIADGSGDAEVVFGDDRVVAFLDHRPLFPGHVLVVPRHHCQDLVQLPSDEVEILFGTVQRLAAAVVAGVEGAQGTFVAINNRVSQSVPHLHVHVVPRRKGDGLRGFFWPRHPYDDGEHRALVGAAIRAALADEG
jgi:histidine triad (HIT) family protein